MATSEGVSLASVASPTMPRARQTTSRGFRRTIVALCGGPVSE